jgi:hypothetical protein
MLNARALSSVALLFGFALLSSIAVPSSFAMQRANDGFDAAAPQRPVEAYQTGEGVIVLSNRPATAEPEAIEPAADAATPQSSNAVAPTPVTASASPSASGEPASEPPASHAATALGVGLFVAILALAGAALLVQRRRTRSTARYAALLAGSEPVGTPSEAPAPVAPGPFAPVPVVVEPRPAAPARSAEERSSPRSAPPPSGISAPPASERQWQSQPPPRNVKDPPE